MCRKTLRFSRFSVPANADATRQTALNLSAPLQTDTGFQSRGDRARLRGPWIMDQPTIFLSRLGKFAMIPVGLVLLLAAVWSVWSTKAWLARAVEVQGLVIEMVRVRDSEDKGYLFFPIVRYRTVDGTTHEFESGLRTNPPAYHAGQTVAVVYDPLVPQSAAIRGVLSLWLMPIILNFIGTIFLAIGTAMMLMSNWASRVLDQPTPSAVVSRPGPERRAAFNGTRS